MSDDDDNEDGKATPPTFSRLERGGTRGYRMLTRTSSQYRSRDRFPRQRRQHQLAKLLGILIAQHGLTDEVRQRAVCLYWPEIVGERVASKTSPLAFSEGLLQVSAINSSWVHEMRFRTAQLVAQINSWVDTNRVWLGPPPLVTDIRFTLGTQRRELLVDPEHARQLRLRHLRRTRPAREIAPPIVSDVDREAIQRETSTILDPELRAIVERVRVTWNR
jgi:hypothetical protein